MYREILKDDLDETTFQKLEESVVKICITNHCYNEDVWHAFYDIMFFIKHPRLLNDEVKVKPKIKVPEWIKLNT